MEPEMLLSEAEAELAKIEARIARLIEDLRRCESEAEQLRGVSAWLRKKAGVGPLADDGTGREKGAPRAGSKTEQIVNAAITAMHEFAAPMTIASLYESILAAGITIGGKSPRANLAGYLSRDPRVEFQHGVGWKLRRTPPVANAELDIGTDTSGPPKLDVPPPGSETPTSKPSDSPFVLKLKASSAIDAGQSRPPVPTFRWHKKS